MNKIISDILAKMRKGNSDFNSGVDSAFATLKQLKSKTKVAGMSIPWNDKLHKPKIDNEGGSPSEADKKDLMDKAQAVRDKSKDLIDDNDELIQNTNQENNTQEDVKKELEDIDKKAKEIQQKLKNEENPSKETLDKVNQDLNKLQKRQERINKIKNFWDDPKNIKDFNSDVELKKEYKKYKDELEKARKSAAERNYIYKPASISEIVKDLVNTLKKGTNEYRDSDYEHVNPNAEYYDYVTPGRFTNTKEKIPNVVFYFDMSGSWSRNAEKITMGHRIEEALKKLHQQKKIKLACFDFAIKTAPSRANSNEIGSGNSDAPFPHAINLVNLKELDNVIIMTDSDPQVNQDLNVPGMAWLLFYDTVSQTIIDHTKTKKQKNKKIYMIKH